MTRILASTTKNCCNLSVNKSIITLANINQFSKFFHQSIQKKICNVNRLKISTSPVLCCYPTLWNLKH